MILLLHFLIIILIFLSPFILSWKIVLVFIILYYIQLFIFGNCLLTIAQFKEHSRSTTFYSFILEKLGFFPNKKVVRIIVDYFLPWIILMVAIIWQHLLSHVVWFQF